MLSAPSPSFSGPEIRVQQFHPRNQQKIDMIPTELMKRFAKEGW
jgi:hypothetical protein